MFGHQLKGDLKVMLRFSSAAACPVATKKDAIGSRPGRTQGEALLQEY